jgi:hypothetical protein
LENIVLIIFCAKMYFANIIENRNIEPQDGFRHLPASSKVVPINLAHALLACKMEACRDGAEQLQCISGIEVVC